MMNLWSAYIATLLLMAAGSVGGFSSRPNLKACIKNSSHERRQVLRPLFSSTEPQEQQEVQEEEEVLELMTDDEISAAVTEADKPSGPLFISQGELDPDALNPDLSDAKQTRVLIYTILSILPVLFLIPLMLSRELIPLDMMPPVDM
mmetsp:Transcript_25347/g.58253  ORF Transcript_25347/g.58253 Transcript_25347/m.58253 type:complete len:147 (-) Transcript_25347:252-692(-)